MQKFAVRSIGTWPTTFVTCLILLFLLLPTLILIPVSFGADKYLEFPPRAWSLVWYQTYFSDSEWLAATKFSLAVASVTAVVTMLIAMPLTLALERGRLPGRTLLRGLVLAPMILPHIVIAVALYISFAKWRLVGSLSGIVVAHVVLCLPFGMLTLAAAVQKLDPSLDMAAANLGATRWATYRHITLPLLWPALAAGLAFVFITSFDEAVVSNFLSSAVTKTFAKKMFEDIDFDVTPVVAAASTLLIAGILLLVGAAQLVGRIGKRRQ